MVSIIIPYYNNAQDIERSLRSVFEQTFQEFEIILINDASPDWDIGLSKINSFNDNRLRIINHEKNKNGAVARNTGIKYAKYEFIAFLDADDEWLPTHLDELLCNLKSNNVDLVYASCLVKSNSEYILPKKGVNESLNLSEYLFCNDGFIQTSGILMKSEIALLNPFNEQLRRHQDYDILLRLEAKNIKFSWSKPITVTVHWENNDIDKKGGTIEFSEKWFEQYKVYMSKKAQTHFHKKFIVNRYLVKRDILLALKSIKNCNLKYFKIKDWYLFLSLLFFGKIFKIK
jgi:glycosyltransferase involved in cell wall biosynthesis